MTQPTDREQSARDDLYDALDQSWYRWDPQSMAKGTGIIRLIDAHVAEVRAAVLREAADKLTALAENAHMDARSNDDIGHASGLENAAHELRRMAEEGR